MIPETVQQLRARDAASRLIAQSTFDLPVVLEAGAGTGKTATLVARVVAWCLGPGWDRAAVALPGDSPDRVAARVMDRVVAITFTEAAAGEMATRVSAALAAIERDHLPPGVMAGALPPPAVRAPRARHLLAATDHLFVRTIHAFCRRLLLAWPLEAGLHPAMEVDADGARLGEVVDAVVSAWIRTAYTGAVAEAGDPGDADILTRDCVDLARVGVGPADIHAAVLGLAQRSADPDLLEQDVFPPDQVVLTRDQLLVSACDLARLAAPMLALKRSPASMRVAAWAAALAARLPPAPGEPPGDLIALKRAVEIDPLEDVLDRLKSWAADDFNATEQKAAEAKTGAADLPAIAAAAAALLPLVDRVRRFDMIRLRAGGRVVAHLLRQVGHRLRSAGILTFSGLLIETRSLLRRRADVRDAVRGSMDQLLVDEFQDTDHLQCELLRLLALPLPAADPPAADPPACPGLFLVGDPKQSIYGWRSADLAAYEAFVAEVIAIGGSRHPLCVNFRSVPAILDEVDRVCRPGMPWVRHVQPAFEPLVPAEEHVGAVGFLVHADPVGPAPAMDAAAGSAGAAAGMDGAASPGADPGSGLPGFDLDLDLDLDLDFVDAAAMDLAASFGPSALPSVPPSAPPPALPGDGAAAAAAPVPRFAPVEHHVSWGWKDGAPLTELRSADATALEARHLAAEIYCLHHDHGVAWREIAVLMRSTGDLDDYTGELRALGIPYAVSRDHAYYQRREIIDAAALIRCILDPNDHVALVTVLRSTLCGVPDGALIPLWTRHFPQLLSELHRPEPAALARIRAVVLEAVVEIPPDIPGIARVAGWEDALLHTVAVVAHLRSRFQEDAPDLWVESLRTMLLLEVSEAARYQGAWRLANLDRFLRLLQVALEEGSGDEQEVLRALRRGVGEEREAAEGRPMDAAEDVVRLMTIHKAKGLDFAHVYLVQHHRRSHSASVPPLDWHEHAEIAPGAGPGAPRAEFVLFGAPTPGYAAVAARRALVERAERVRLLYVALTRAKHRLVTMGSWPPVPRPKPFQEADTFTSLLCNRSGIPDLPAGMMRIAADPAGSADALVSGDALWRFPVLLSRAVVPAAPLTDVPLPPLPPLEEIARISAQIQSEAAAAALRMRASTAAFLSADGSTWKHHAPAPGSAWAALPPARAAALMGEIAAVLRRLLSQAPDPSGEDLSGEDLSGEDLSGRLSLLLRDRVDAPLFPAALEAASRLVAAFRAGPLPARLALIHRSSPQGLARAVPLLLPPAGQVTGFRHAVVDLLYVDPDQGVPVLGVWRVDDVEPGSALTVARQSAHIHREVIDGLGAALGMPVISEFWFIGSGLVVRP